MADKFDMADALDSIANAVEDVEAGEVDEETALLYIKEMLRRVNR